MTSPEAARCCRSHFNAPLFSVIYSSPRTICHKSNQARGLTIQKATKASQMHVSKLHGPQKITLFVSSQQNWPHSRVASCVAAKRFMERADHQSDVFLGSRSVTPVCRHCSHIINSIYSVFQLYAQLGFPNNIFTSQRLCRAFKERLIKKTHSCISIHANLRGKCALHVGIKKAKILPLRRAA